MSNKKHWDNFVSAAIEWVFRKKSRGVIVLKSGVALLVALIAGLTLSFTIPTPNGSFTIGWGNSGVDPIISFVLIGLAVFVAGAGVWLVFKEAAAEKRKRVFVIELRGLRDWDGPPLSEHVPSALVGTREQITIDLRQRVTDGVIVNPAAALARINNLRLDLEAREATLDSRDFVYVVGGLAAVPLTFLTGVVLDDETPITFMDWDRHNRTWHALGDADDGKRFEVEGLASVTSVGEVILAVSASYSVDIANAQLRVPGAPLVQMKLDGANTTSHLSGKKQIALGEQFLDVCLSLQSKGVTKVHLFLAAPSSLTFRLGTLYDKRNLPPVSIYQYERGEQQPFAWAVDMPVAGLREPRLVT